MNIGSRRDLIRWKISSAKAENFLILILSYLTTKKEQAEAALRFRNLISRKNKIISDMQMEQREVIYLELKNAKIQMFGGI